MPMTIDSGLTVDSSGSLVVQTGVEAIAQRAVQRMRYYLGESFRRPDEGVPYYTDPILGSTNLQPDAAIQLLVAQILDAVPEIVDASVLEVKLDPLTRRLSFRLSLTTDTGETTEIEGTA